MEDVLPYTIGLQTSCEIWESLKEAFGAPTQSRLLQLQMQLFNLKKNDLSVTAYLRQVWLIVDELAPAGTILDKGTINTAIFNDMGAEFSETIAALANQETSSSFGFVTHALVSHEIWLNQANFVNLESPVAYYTSYDEGAKGRNQSYKGGSGKAQIGFTKSPATGKSGKGFRREPCPICAASDHGPYKCPY